MSKNDPHDPPPPPFTMPGDNPRLDELIKELSADGQDGDPLFVSYRKVQVNKPQDEKSARSAAAAGRSNNEEASPVPSTSTSTPTSTAPVATPDAVEVHSAPSKDVSAGPARRSPRWLGFLALAIVAPAITLALGALWVGMKDRGAAERATGTNETARAGASTTTVPMPMPAAPNTAAIEAATAGTTPTATAPAVPAAPTSEPDAGAARVPAARPNSKLRPQPQPRPTTSSAPHAGSGDNDDPLLNK